MTLNEDPNSTANSGNSGVASSVSNVAGALSALSSASGSIKNAWEKSGASNLLSSASSSLPQSAQDSLSSLTSTAKSHLPHTKLRSPSIFFGIGEENAYYMERVPSLLMERIKHNLHFFLLNYVLVTGILFALSVISSPSAIVGLLCLGGGWVGVVRMTSSGSVTVKGVTISQKQATIGMGLFSIIALLWLLSHIFWMALGTSGFLCGIHCLLRDASMHKDESDRVVMQGDLTLDEESSFLNSSSSSGTGVGGANLA